MVLVCLGRILEGSHASFVETVPFKTIAAFTALQLAYFALCFGVTWIPIGGILFPVPFFLLIIIREHLLPKMFKPNHLQELDASGYEEIIGAPHGSLRVRFIVQFNSCYARPRVCTFVCIFQAFQLMTGKCLIRIRSQILILMEAQKTFTMQRYWMRWQPTGESWNLEL